MIAYPIRYPIRSHRVYPSRGRIPRPDPSRPVPLSNKTASFSTHPQSPPANRGDASAAPRPEVSR